MLKQLGSRLDSRRASTHPGDGGGGTGQAVNYDLEPGQAPDKRTDNLGAFVVGVNGQDEVSGCNRKASCVVGLGLFRRARVVSPSAWAMHEHLAVPGHMGEKGEVDLVLGQRRTDRGAQTEFPPGGGQAQQAPSSRTFRPPILSFVPAYPRPLVPRSGTVSGGDARRKKIFPGRTAVPSPKFVGVRMPYAATRLK